MSGLCCDIGYTCNYQSLLCISNGIGSFNSTLPATVTSESGKFRNSTAPPKTSAPPTSATVATATGTEATSTGTATTPTVTIQPTGGQSKLGLSLILILAGCGLAFLLG